MGPNEVCDPGFVGATSACRVLLDCARAGRITPSDVAAMLVAATSLGVIRPARAQSSKTRQADVAPTKPGSHTSFGPIKQIDAGLLNVGYAEVGPTDGPVVILLHGWPYDIHSYVDVAPSLASAGYRAIVPYLRGYGTTRFLSSDTLRNGQQSVIA